MKGRRIVNLKTFIVAVLVMLSLISISQAQEPEKIEKVITTGIGTDFEKAKQNAVRNAIEQAIGTYVSSDTIVKNSTLINDDVLTYSGGYVKETKVISQKRDKDGLFNVQIETLVVATQLKRKLESLNIATQKLEGGGLFSEAASRVKEQISARELLKKIISKYPQAAYTIEVGKAEIQAVDAPNNMANVNIPLIFRWDKSFLAELGDVLSRISREKLELTPYSLNIGMTPIGRAYYGAKEHNGILCMAQRGVLKSGKADTCWIFQRPFGQSEGESLLNLPVVPGQMTLSIIFKDRGNKIMDLLPTEWVK